MVTLRLVPGLTTELLTVSGEQRLVLGREARVRGSKCKGNGGQGRSEESGLRR